MRNSRRGIATLAARAAAGALLVTTAVIGAPAAANAVQNDGNVTNSGSSTMTVCKSATSETTCGNTQGALFAGQNSKSKYGWVDTDMILIPANRKLERYSFSGGSVKWNLYAVAGSSSRWMKVPGTNGSAIQFRIV